MTLITPRLYRLALHADESTASVPFAFKFLPWLWISAADGNPCSSSCSAWAGGEASAQVVVRTTASVLLSSAHKSPARSSPLGPPAWRFAVFRPTPLVALSKLVVRRGCARSL